MKSNDDDLAVADVTLDKCDKKIDELNGLADEAIRRFPPKSAEAKKFNAHKEDLKRKAAQARNIDKRGHKEHSDQR